jgi:hypothetical protein|tara:strand:- start:1253 stop:1501 length:249 start_codon:yes stop_codon:yes gene_type:complete
MISADHLKTLLAVEEANEYEPMYTSDVNIEGYDPNFSASVNAINFKLNQEVMVDWGKNKILTMRLIYPIVFWSIIFYFALQV